MSSVYIYWDESHFWGVLAYRALRAWGIPCRLARSQEIAQGLLAGKSEGRKPALLLVPGGRAKGKYELLGKEGRAAIRQFVKDGGTYLGFCGGAGLALDEKFGLGLIPWKRQPFTDRLQHFLSGHVEVAVDTDHALVPEGLGEEALIPVWWPGRFAPVENGVEVLASYKKPGSDFMVADLHLSSLPAGTLTDWQNLYGVNIRPDFFVGAPCVVHNAYGKGRVILSYAHLETPASPQANYWLGDLLGTILGTEPERTPIPAWDLGTRPVHWDDTALAAARAALDEIILTGVRHMLLFWRTPWLLGWRRGIPGAAINSLYCLACEVMAQTPADAVFDYWSAQSEEFIELAELFRKGVTGYLLAERLAMTVLGGNSGGLDRKALAEQKEALFGKHPAVGGVYGRLTEILENLYVRQQGFSTAD